MGKRVSLTTAERISVNATLFPFICNLCKNRTTLLSVILFLLAKVGLCGTTRFQFGESREGTCAAASPFSYCNRFYISNCME